MRFLKKLIKILLLTIIAAIVLFALFVSYITYTDYQPEKIEVIVQKGEYNIEELDRDTFSIMNWNIGYAGLGAEMDFFYDGGTKVRPTKDLNKMYLDNILKFIVATDSVDFWLIQEADMNSKRSYFENQVDRIVEIHKGSYGVFAKNYQCKYVPVPISDPLGYVEAGLMTFSDFPPQEAVRHAYPLIASWPNKLFLLDRCFLVNRYPLKNGNDLVVVNTHNSAYVYDSVLRIKELMIIREVVLNEYKKGNYVVVGGDWNQIPPSYSPAGNYNGHNYKPSIVKMNDDFMPKDWVWAYDDSAPTNRSNYKSFVRGENTTTCLDYYLVSPNVEVVDVEVVDLLFAWSDHNPIYLKVRLKD